MSLPKLYTKKETCEALRMGKTTLESRVKEGALTPIKDQGRIFFTEEEILKYLARRTLKKVS